MMVPKPLSTTVAVWLAMVGLVGGGLSGCGSAPSQAVEASAIDRPLRVVATTGMVADLVRMVGGSRADVTALMGPGIDPHLYKPTRNDVRLLQQAQLIVTSGLNLEGRMGEVFHQLGRNGKRVIAVTEGLDPAVIRHPDGPGGHADPHVWMDVKLWADCAEVVSQALCDLDPTHADEYRARLRAGRTELVQLDADIRLAIQSIPAEQRTLVTAHDAFGYYGATYGLAVRSVQGVSTESEAGIQDVNGLVDFLVEQRIPAIFFESSVNSKPILAIIEGCQSRGVTVAQGGELYSDAMGPAETYEGTYPGMLDANTTRIVTALGGMVPATGLRGRLTPPVAHP